MRIENPRGGYAFLKGIAPYSAGVVAQAGFAVERALFAVPVPLAAAFERVTAHLRGVGRPAEALCAMELRSPAPFTFAGFDAFNREYVKYLERLGILRDGLNPVARTNVAPESGGPKEPGVYAFSYTVAAPGAAPSFILAGTGELPEGSLDPGQVVRKGETSSAAMMEKAHFVLGLTDARVRGLGVTWERVTAVDVYTVHDVSPVFLARVLPRTYRNHGITWHDSRPPIIGVEFEMDARGCARELVLRE